MYQLDPAQGFDRARQLMARTINVDVARDIGGDQQRIGRLDTRYCDIRCKQILLPVWVSAFRFRNKTYRFLVNGRTGEVQGERPYSPWKIIAAILFGAVLVAVLALLFSQQGQIRRSGYDAPVTSLLLAGSVEGASNPTYGSAML